MDYFVELQFSKNNFIDHDNKVLEYVDFSKRLTIFIGTNNSGKSRLLKQMLASYNKANVLCSYKDNVPYDSYYKNILYYLPGNTKEYENFIKNHTVISNYFYLKRFFNTNSSMNIYLNKIDDNIIRKDIKEKAIYIPILRGNENFESCFPNKDSLKDITMNFNQRDKFEEYIKSVTNIYTNKTRRSYSISDKNIFTGEKLYDEIVNILLGDENERRQLKDFEDFISLNFYDNNAFHINPNIKDNCLKVKIGDNSEYEIHNMGDGIKQLITILYPIYKYKDADNIFFIEEPEINLHPAFQRKLMDLLLSDTFKKCHFVITTHSNHIMDIINYSDDVNLYKFKKIKDKIQITKEDNNYLSILNDLGVSSSASLLSNCSIWVEGISDRIYIKKYLEIYLKEHNIDYKYKDNINYCFIEYGGINLKHYNFSEKDNTEDIFIKAINHNAFLIVDNDDTKNRKKKDGSDSNKELAKKEYKNILKDNFYELKSREIENTIKIDILEKVLRDDNNGDLTRKKYLGNQEYLYNQDLISQSKTKLGNFIMETYNVNKNYRASGGTILQKATFAKKVCDQIKSINDLTDEALDLVEKIVKFIDDNNKI